MVILNKLNYLKNTTKAKLVGKIGFFSDKKNIGFYGDFNQNVQVLLQDIFNNFNPVNSYGLAILRSNFIKDSNTLTQTKGDIENAIISAYYGGRSEVFKPIGYNLFAYDYNSLYPSAMLKDMPVGNPIFSLTKDLSKIFGFVKVKVTTPDNIYPFYLVEL